ncbi:ComEC/Rec2 family competence protein [Pedobacter sp. L105]|uniref:ComEC/Rec2 family competence protein n=1 Tax=Pedobacter sp. L105 TaxID=1641871 RepID=UPI0020B1475B|nr:ComEC/Rec2 family competence protein [Pedobacter sp. L105]
MGIWVLRDVRFTKLNLLLLSSTIFIFTLLLIINYLYVSLKVYHYKRIIAILVYLLFFSLGGLWCFRHTTTQNPSCFSHTKAAFLKISVADEPQQHGTVLRFKAKVWYNYGTMKKRPSTGFLLVTIRLNSLHRDNPKYGEVYLIPAHYTPIDPPCNPGEFDFRFWLANQHVEHQIFLQPEELVPDGEYKGSSLIAFALKLRQQQTEVYRKLIKNDAAFAVASALILGYRAELDAETLSAYSSTGTIHALSVSGMHVGIVYLVLQAALSWMNRKRMLKVAKLLLLLVTIWFYTLLTGYSASVLRSAIMLSLFIIAKHMGKNAGGDHVLYISAFCLLLYDPFLLWDAGFQLSYMAVLGLIWLEPKIRTLMSFKWRWLQKLWSLIAVSIAAQILTFPLSSYYFHQFPVYFILSNLFITLPVAILMYSGLAILLFHLYWLTPAFEWLILFMNKGLAAIALLPYSSIGGIELNKTELVLLYLFLLLCCHGLLHRRKAFVFTALVLLTCLQGLRARDKIISLKQKEIILFSLKKNYAVAFVCARTAILVTDLKPADRDFKVHLQPALDERKISTVTCLPWNSSHRFRYFNIQNHQLYFRNFRILLIDSSFNRKKLNRKLVVDAVWLHGSPKVKPSELKQEISFRELWIDASNKNYVLKAYERDSINFSCPTIVLKNKKASLINLK